MGTTNLISQVQNLAAHGTAGSFAEFEPNNIALKEQHLNSKVFFVLG